MDDDPHIGKRYLTSEEAERIGFRHVQAALQQGLQGVDLAAAEALHARPNWRRLTAAQRQLPAARSAELLRGLQRRPLAQARQARREHRRRRAGGSPRRARAPGREPDASELDPAERREGAA